MPHSKAATPRNIWAVGRNYADHAKELNNPLPKDPIFFLKSGSCVQTTSELVFPAWAKNVHHEVELGLVFDEQLNVSSALCAIDFTERDLQAKLKSESLPWTLAKSFTGACVGSKTFAVNRFEDLDPISLRLWIDDELKQHGHVKDMIFPPHFLVEYVKSRFPVEPGDWLLTGTPSGVGAVRSGQQIRIAIDGHVEAHWRVR